MTNTFGPAGQRFKLSEELIQEYSTADKWNPEGRRYEYARVARDSYGSYVADCFIEDETGNRHCGYEFPVSMRFSALSPIASDMQVYIFSNLVPPKAIVVIASSRAEAEQLAAKSEGIPLEAFKECGLECQSFRVDEPSTVFNQ